MGHCGYTNIKRVMLMWQTLVIEQQSQHLSWLNWTKDFHFTAWDERLRWPFHIFPFCHSCKKWPAADFFFSFFVFRFGKLWEREKVHHKQTQLLAQAVRSNKDSPWCTCSDSSLGGGKGGSRCAWYAQIPSEPRLFHISTPGDPLRLNLNSLKHLTLSWLMG